MKRLMLAAALTATATPALAHKLKVFVGAEGTEIVGAAYFAGGAPAMDVAGRLLGADGAVLAEFRTDANGNFRLSLTQRQDVRVSVDSGDGHVAEAAIGGAEQPAASPAVTVPDAVEAAVARQILPLRKQIDAMEDRARFSDIMGGIGTIFGLFGVFAWVASRKGRSP